MQSTVPLMMHGDAVPIVGCAKVWAKLMQCFSWSGFLSTGSTKERSFFSGEQLNASMAPFFTKL